MFRLNSPPVVLETVDEETIIVNLDSGSYYDLNHSAGRILAALASGADVERATGLVAEAYGIAAAELDGTVSELADQLVGEDILVADPAGANGDGAIPTTGESSPSRPYEAPRLGKHTDMRELLLLDPIHEVDESGWPNRA